MDLEQLFDQSIKKYSATSTDQPKQSVFDRPEQNIEIIEEKAQKEPKTDDPERVARTIFISNVPVTAMTEKSIQKKFKKFLSEVAQVESIRFRSIALEKPANKAMKKVGVLKGEFHPERDNMNAYVVLVDKNEVEVVIEKLNGSEFEGKHLFFDHAEKTKDDIKKNMKKTVFLGGVSFSIAEEEIYSHFSNCGDIRNIRLVRDQATGVGKGFGYVQFADRASVSLALQLNGSECGGRVIRVTKCADAEKQKKNAAKIRNKPVKKIDRNKKQVNTKSGFKKKDQVEKDRKLNSKKPAKSDEDKPRKGFIKPKKK